MPPKNTIESQAVAIAGLGAEYCSIVISCSGRTTREFCGDILRYLPRIYITISDLTYSFDGIGVQGMDNGAIYSGMDEDTYNQARCAMEATLGEHDMYLDTPADAMQYSDTPVAVSLSEKLADIYQEMFNMADTVRQAPQHAWTDVMEDLKYRFDSYLSETICDAMRAANFIYRKGLEEQAI